MNKFGGKLALNYRWIQWYWVELGQTISAGASQRLDPGPAAGTAR